MDLSRGFKCDFQRISLKIILYLEKKVFSLNSSKVFQEIVEAKLDLIH